MSIGRIVVDLLAKTGSFETDINRSAKLAAKRAQEIDQAFKRAGVAIGAALAAGAGAAAIALKSTIDRMDEMSKSAQKVGLPTEEFSKLSYAAGLADVSTESLVGALGKLTKSQAAALNSTSEQAKVFNALGISIKNADGSLRGSSDVLADFADRFQQLKGSPEAMAAGFSLFGRSFQELIPLLKDGGGSIRDAGDELQKMGGVLSTDAGKAAEDFNDNLTRLKTAGGALAMQVATDLLPNLEKAADDLADVARQGDLARNIATLFGGAISAGIGTLQTYNGLVDRTSIGFAALAEAASGALEILRNLGPGGLLMEGSVANGYARIRDAIPNGQKELAALQERQRQAHDAAMVDQAIQDSIRRNHTPARSNDDGTSVRLAFGGGMTGSRRGQARDVDETAQAVKRLNEQLDRELALVDAKTDSERLAYDLQHGELAKASDNEKALLLVKQQSVDLMKSEREEYQKNLAIEEERAKAAKAQRDRFDETVKGMESELIMLTGTNAERQHEIALRLAGADATDEQVASLERLVARQEQASRVAQQWADAERTISDTLYDLATNFGDAEKTIKGFFDSIAQQITKFIADEWARKLTDALKQYSQNNQGEGGWGGFISGLLSAVGYGGGKASGGDVASGTTYLVGEQGPELFVPRSSGYIVPATQTAQIGSGRGFSQTVNVAVQGSVDRRTPGQIAREVGRQARRELVRTG